MRSCSPRSCSLWAGRGPSRGSDLPPSKISEFADSVTDTAGAVIQSLTRDPATVRVAEVARDALTSGIVVGSLIAASCLVLGVIATALIPDTAAVGGQAGEPEDLLDTTSPVGSSARPHL